MITVSYAGTDVRFHETEVTPESPGVVHGALYKGHFYEETFLTYIRSLGRRGTYLDIGAFVGTHTMFFAALCDSDRVHSFEPRPRIHRRLAANVELNELGHKVTLHQVALSDEPAEISLTFGRETTVVPAKRLDDLIREPVSVIKIDVEGMEPQVLRGASRILRTSKPVVFAEARTGPEYEAVTRTLRRSGYQPTGKVFNSSPTYEFVHVSRRRTLMDSPLGVRARARVPLAVRRRLRRFVPPPRP